MLPQLDDEGARILAALALGARRVILTIIGDAEPIEDFDLHLGLLAKRPAVADHLEREALVGV
eukprot:scaffold236539_cov33-Tisochrysis_lutea.AAC.1